MGKHGLVPDGYWCEGIRCHYTEAGCGCVIHDCSDDPDVEYCPLHAQAEGMRDLIRRGLGLLMEWPVNQSAAPYGGPYWMQDARALLRATERRETP